MDFTPEELALFVDSISRSDKLFIVFLFAMFAIYPRMVGAALFTVAVVIFYVV